MIPRSQAAEGAQLNAWSNQTAGQKWTVCYSSFTMDKKAPNSFHDACDKFKPTVTVAHTTSGCGKGICGKCLGTKGCSRSCSTDGTQCPVTGKPCGHVYPGNFTFGGFVRLPPTLVLAGDPD